MCGICGYVGANETGLIEEMTTALTHRGPDSEGYFRDANVALGHRRLSIIDVAGGHQPIYNEDESIVLIGNGEIYNHEELRADLERRGHRFRTRSDNEVVLHLYEEYGPQCVTRLLGMFAIAIYDRRERVLFLARDRLGIKPLYYAERPDRFLFASEVKSVLRHRPGTYTLNPRAVHDYLALRYVPGPTGMFNEVRKLPAAHYALVDEQRRIRLHRYWEPPLHDGPFAGSDDEYLEGFEEHFQRSIRRRLMSEVPFGAYLSGGLDSSTIVADMAEIVDRPVQTFSVGFGYEFDELADAAATAERFGCDHTEVHCRLSDLSLLPRMVYHLDEPVGDPIIIPMYLLAREAKRRVTVILTGEGADETLGGYLFHKALLAGARLSRMLTPGVARTLLAGGVSMTPPAVLNLAFDYPAALGRRGKDKLLDYCRLLGPENLPAAWRHLISLFDERDCRALYTPEFEATLASAPPPPNGVRDAGPATPDLNRILDLQFAHWLPDDILMKQDKLSMASAIEARVPFLDHELVEYSMRLPPRLKIRHGRTKYILRRYAAKRLPPSVASRRKRPFYAPIEKFFEEPAFRGLMEDTLSPRNVESRGIFRPEAIAQLVDRMRSGEFMYVKQVFSLIVLELWFRCAVDNGGQASPP